MQDFNCHDYPNIALHLASYRTNRFAAIKEATIGTAHLTIPTQGYGDARRFVIMTQNRSFAMTANPSGLLW